MLLPRLLLLDWAGPWQALVSARDFGAQFRLHAVGPGDVLALGTGLSLNGMAPLPECLPEGAVVVVPGVHTTPDFLATPEVRAVCDWLARVITPGHRLVTICAGALIAAQAGFLAGRRCTTHHELTARLAELEPRATVCADRIFVQDGPVYTSAGITAGLDLALFLVGEWWGQAMALAVARELVVYLRRSGDDPQLSPWLSWRNHLEPKIHAVQDRICRHPERRWSLGELAEAAHLSVRHLTRVFRETTGISIHDYQQRIALDHARRLLSETRHSIERVAELAGFGSARSLRRAWATVHELPPSRLRA